jgi:hypothetical protein
LGAGYGGGNGFVDFGEIAEQFRIESDRRKFKTTIIAFKKTTLRAVLLATAAAFAFFVVGPAVSGADMALA